MLSCFTAYFFLDLTVAPFEEQDSLPILYDLKRGERDPRIVSLVWIWPNLPKPSPCKDESSFQASKFQHLGFHVCIPSVLSAGAEMRQRMTMIGLSGATSYG